MNKTVFRQGFMLLAGATALMMAPWIIIKHLGTFALSFAIIYIGRGTYELGRSTGTTYTKIGGIIGVISGVLIFAHISMLMLFPQITKIVVSAASLLYIILLASLGSTLYKKEEEELKILGIGLMAIPLVILISTFSTGLFTGYGLDPLMLKLIVIGSEGKMIPMGPRQLLLPFIQLAVSLYASFKVFK